MEWAELVGLHISGESKAADMGFDFGAELAKFSVDELVELRWQLKDHFIDAYRSHDPDEMADNPIYSLVRGLVDIVEAEIGGRWIE